MTRDWEKEDERRILVCTAITVLLYAAALGRGLAMTTGLAAFARNTQRALSRVEYRVDFQEPPPPPPAPPEPEPEPQKTPEPETKPAPAPKAPAPPAAAPPPAAAQAGRVLAADPDTPLDLTGDGFVQGNADSYAGGVTSSAGTSKTAVRDTRAVASGGVPSAPPGPVGPSVDRSSPARPTSGSWDHCGFPAEADVEQVNYARTTIAVTIDAQGRATNVSVVRDPGYGFGALARQCALRERYEPARGKDGNPVTATQLITINFRR